MSLDRTVPRPLSDGQQNVPDAQDLRRYFDGIFQRQYYTESGPLVRQLESQIGQRLGVEYVVCVSNPTIAWLMLLDAAELSEGVIYAPVTSPVHLQEALRWMRRPIGYFDVVPEFGFQPNRRDVEQALRESASLLIGVNGWGGACDLAGLRDLAEEQGIRLFVDASESFGGRINAQPIGSWGAAEVFSFQSANLINGAGGACIVTSDEALADRLRCMRSSGGVVRQVKVRKTVNGRMSEAQAAFALMSLDRIEALIERNRAQHTVYQQALSSVPGVQFLSAQNVEHSNYQQAVITVPSRAMRDELLEQLNVAGPVASVASYPLADVPIGNFPGAQTLASVGLSLPLGSGVDADCIRDLCTMVTAVIQRA